MEMCSWLSDYWLGFIGVSVYWFDLMGWREGREERYRSFVTLDLEIVVVVVVCLGLPFVCYCVDLFLT